MKRKCKAPLTDFWSRWRAFCVRLMNPFNHDEILYSREPEPAHMDMIHMNVIYDLMTARLRSFLCLISCLEEDRMSLYGT